MKILLIDDNQDLLEVMFDAINKDKNDVRGTTCSQAAVELIKKNTFDLIICDLNLDNNQSGIDLLTIAQKIQPEAKLVLTSGDSEIKHDSFKFIFKLDLLNYLESL